jgi:FMN phosphatase YigB (HAD superfamily)
VPALSERLIAVDFDGTVVRGDAPVRYYGAQIAAGLPGPAAARYRAALDQYLSAEPAAAAGRADPAEAAALAGAIDSWEAARDLGLCHGVSMAAIKAAFASCREWMIGPECDVGLAAPVIDALASLRAHARITLVTNSPEESMLPLLRRLGILDCFDQIVAGAGKPAGMRSFLDRSLADGLGGEGWRIFSLGDHYRNDIEPAVRIGAATGYIDRYGRADGPASARGRIAEDVLPALRAWAAPTAG